MLAEKENKIGEVTTRNFRAAQVFEEFGLDFCCGGKKTIEEACRDKGIDAGMVIDRLQKIEEENPSGSHYNNWDIQFLTDYIVNNHHSYVQRSIPGIEHRLDKAVSSHGEQYPELRKIKEIFSSVKEDLLSHMAKEEKMLFPYIKKMNFAFANDMEIPIPPFGNVSNPIAVMEAEHQEAGDEMAEINKLTNNYTPPENACGTFKVLYAELQDFERDLHTHVHLENNILFPKAVELEKKLMNRNESLCNLYTTLNKIV